MKKILRSAVAIILCISIFGGTQVMACSPNRTIGGFSTIIDFMERFASVFTGNKNEDTEMDITIEQGEIFKANKYFKSSHASTIVKMPDGNFMSAFFAGSAEGNADIRIWYSIHDGENWSAPKQMASADPVAHWNPVLVNYGDYVRLYYKVGMEIPYWVTK